MILKSACSYNASYIDRLISVFMRSLQKMVREHLSPQQANPGVTETNTGTGGEGLAGRKVSCLLSDVQIGSVTIASIRRIVQKFTAPIVLTVS